MLTGWRYWWNRYLGWIPFQPCRICWPSCPVHGAVLYGETQEDRDARQKALYPTLAEVFPDRPEYDKSAEDEECQF